MRGGCYQILNELEIFFFERAALAWCSLLTEFMYFAKVLSFVDHSNVVRNSYNLLTFFLFLGSHLRYLISHLYN